ncbi:hypothetical protein HanIR_Chr13g0619921 [Helianthus annuus]|nr:hypothetical protein HanIR_Chr13g0619921 [Helianthus annuus]
MVKRRLTEAKQSMRDPECFSCTLASSHLWNYITETHLASFAHGSSGEFITPTFYCFTFLQMFSGVERNASFAK